MTTTANISGTTPNNGANSASSQGIGAGGGGLAAFLNVMLGQAGGAQGGQNGQDLTAKIAALLKNNPTDIKGLTALLQKLYPNASTDQLQQTAAQLQAAAPVRASLTSDLSAPLASSAQEDPGIMSDLQQKFDALAQQGPLTADKIAEFRKEAIASLKDKGLDNTSINQYLSSLSSDMSDKLTTSLAAQLAMPLQQGLAGNGNGGLQADPSDDATDPAPAPVGLDQPQAQGTAQLPAQTPVNGTQPDPAPAANTAAAAAPAATQPASAADAAAKPLPAAAMHFLAMSSAQGNDAFGSSGDNQQSFQNAGGQVTVSGLPQGASAVTPQSFVNFMTSASPTAAAQPVTQTVAVQIQQNAAQGVTSFNMQLEPAELGRLEVRLKFDRDGGLKAHVIADKPETLSMLKNDSAQLHRILQQSGLDTDDGSLSFDLRQQGQQQNSDTASNGTGQTGGYDAGLGADADALQANISVQAMGYISQGGVNIMV